MKNAEKKCVEIVRGMQIKPPFPHIKNENVRVFVRDFGEYRDRNASAIWMPMVVRYIVINRDFDFSNDEELEAVLAHELGHHERYAELGAVGYLQLMHNLIIRAELSTVLRADEERYADRKAIEAGCARGLYKLSESITQRSARDDRDCYMSAAEIREYALKIGKW